MTPGNKTFNVCKGARFAHTLLFRQPVTKNPVDLTGAGPFVFIVKHPDDDNTVILTGTVQSSYDATGSAEIILEAAQTDLLDLEVSYNYGIRDAANNAYLKGSLLVEYFAPDPATP